MGRKKQVVCKRGHDISSAVGRYKGGGCKQCTKDLVRERCAQTYPILKQSVFDILGRKCNQCGYDSDIRALQIDHINGNGHEERKKGSWGVYRHVIKTGGVGYQVLCANCNQIKVYENRERYLLASPLGER